MKKLIVTFEVSGEVQISVIKDIKNAVEQILQNSEPAGELKSLKVDLEETR